MSLAAGNSILSLKPKATEILYCEKSQTKCINHLTTHIKCVANEIQVFESALKRVLLSNSFYSTEEYINSNK
jgi:hypothetical protein